MQQPAVIKKHFEVTNIFKEMGKTIYYKGDSIIHLAMIMIDRTKEIVAFDSLTFSYRNMVYEMTINNSKEDLAKLGRVINDLDWIKIEEWVNDNVVSRHFTRNDIQGLGGFKVFCMEELMMNLFKEKAYKIIYNDEQGIYKDQLDIFYKNPIIEKSTDIMKALNIDVSDKYSNYLDVLYIDFQSFDPVIQDQWNNHILMIRDFKNKHPFHPILLNMHSMGIEISIYEDIRVFRYNEIQIIKKLESKEPLDPIELTSDDYSYLSDDSVSMNPEWFLTAGT